jgi:2-dehydropantoate 2-reductase
MKATAIRYISRLARIGNESDIYVESCFQPERHLNNRHTIRELFLSRQCVLNLLYQLAAIIMEKKIKIVVAGIGGVGGFFGSLLANLFYNSKSVDICFIARGENLKVIKSDGITMRTGDLILIAMPRVVTDNPADIGIADYIFVCTKSYDLEEMIASLQPCIGSHTVLIPLLNGVAHYDLLNKLLPASTILKACVYCVTRLMAPGHIYNFGDLKKIVFGTDGEITERQRLLESLLKEATIDASLTDKITPAIWEKFLFISPLATATSFFNSTIGQILEDPNKSKMLAELAEEIQAVALAKGIEVDEQNIQKIFKRLHSLSYKYTSSMHSDYKKGKKKTELEALTGYVIEQGRLLHIQTPAYIRAYEGLTNKAAIN